MSEDIGFFIECLTLKGDFKQDASLTFRDGLNVVSGASDTGKSYALSCIDYAFGAQNPPIPIPESSGYDAVVLSISSRKTKEKFIIERCLAGGDVKLTKLSSQNEFIEEIFLGAKHHPTNPNTLSGVLLSLSGLYGKQIRTNKRNSRRNISFRDVAFLSVVDEERIIARLSPQISANKIQNTAQSETFRLLVSGQQSGFVHSIQQSGQDAGVEAKIELIGSMLAEAEERFASTGINRDTIDSELALLEAAQANSMTEYERARIEIVSLEEKLADQAKIIRNAQSRRQLVVGLVNRFTLLDEHYKADLERLHAIEESGELLEALPSQNCPICGASPDQHKLNKQYRPDEVVASARAEGIKIGELRRDLEKVLKDLKSEEASIDVLSENARQELFKTQSAIESELMPRVKDSAADLQTQNARRDLLIQAKSLWGQVNQLTDFASVLDAAAAQPAIDSELVTSRPTTGEMEEFAASVQDLLVAWKYPGVGRVVFSEDDQDLIISGQKRIGHGKGVRALTCAAFIVGLLRHCRVKQLPHPSLVLLDSPLVAYREPDSVTEGLEDQKLRMAGVKEAFYRSLAAGDANGQVIVFENEDPPNDMVGTFNRIHFSKSSIGRYGLFAK